MTHTKPLQFWELSMLSVETLRQNLYSNISLTVYDENKMAVAVILPYNKFMQIQEALLECESQLEILSKTDSVKEMLDALQKLREKGIRRLTG